MALSEKKMREYVRRLMLSRMRILCNHGFYGLLLMHMKFAVDESCPTAATDGERIYFGTDYLDTLSDSEIDFVMMHEILHVVLQHCRRCGDRDHVRYNIASDIVVNSNIMHSNGDDIKSITIKGQGPSMHKTPNGKEGYFYTAEEVYEMVKPQDQGGDGGFGSDNSDVEGNGGSGDNQKGEGNGKSEANPKNNKSNKGSYSGIDCHDKWKGDGESNEETDIWQKRFMDACESISIREASQDRGLLPAFAKRLFEELKNPKTDWRALLHAFVQEEINDYSFSPPDRRFGDTDFFLPDFNEKDEYAKDILFMIDTSGSMSDEMITDAYCEVKGAIDQFGGRLQGWLGFFDGEVVEPVPFKDEEEFSIIRPYGGGGTSFHCIFSYVKQQMSDTLPVSIIILTDGYAPFPDEKAAMGIPVMWLINNEEVTPPWGKVARI